MGDAGNGAGMWWIGHGYGTRAWELAREGVNGDIRDGAGCGRWGGMQDIVQIRVAWRREACRCKISKEQG